MMRGGCIGVIDYGRGNLLSVAHALKRAGGNVVICGSPEELQRTDKVVLPGVGSFGDCIGSLTKKNFVGVLQDLVIKKGQPFLGICLGMQVMARKGYEAGEWDGLGWIDGEVVRLPDHDPNAKIPHMGWDDIEFAPDSFLFQRVPARPDVYFAHSYYLKCNREDLIDATCEYGQRFPVAVRKGNMVGTQFHPEKSQDIGLTILENFTRWNP